MEECISSGVRIEMSPQNKICGNDISPPDGIEEDEVSVPTPARCVARNNVEGHPTKNLALFAVNSTPFRS